MSIFTRLVIALVVLTSLADFAFAAGTVYVRSYFRKDGTYVRAHTRSSPSSTSNCTTSRSVILSRENSPHSPPMRPNSVSAKTHLPAPAAFLISTSNNLEGRLAEVGGAVYWIENGKRRHIQNPDVLKNLFTGTTTKSNSRASQLPFGSPITLACQLLRSAEDGKVYLIDNGKRRHVASPEALSKNQFNPERIRTVPRSDLARFQNGLPVD